MVTFISSLRIFVLFFIYYVPESSTESTSTTQLDKTKLKILTQDPSDSTETVECESSQYELKEENDLLEYKFKDGAKCMGIGFDNKEVWKYDSTKTGGNPASFFLNIKKGIIVVNLNDTICIYQFDSKEWKSSFSGKPTTVTLDTKSKKDTDDWSYKKEDKVGTYTAKTGKFFNVVRQSASAWWRSGCCSSNCCSSSCCSSNCCTSGCCGSSCGGSSEQEIWRTDKKFECATKVVVSGIGKKEKSVSIHFANGLITKMIRSGKDKPWVDGGTTNNVINESLKTVSITLNKRVGTNNYDYDNNGGKHTYTAKDNLAFKEVKYEISNESTHKIQKVWESKDNEYGNKVVFDTSGTKTMIIIHLTGGKTSKFERSGEGWSETTETTGTCNTTS